MEVMQTTISTSPRYPPDMKEGYKVESIFTNNNKENINLDQICSKVTAEVSDPDKINNFIKALTDRDLATRICGEDFPKYDDTSELQDVLNEDHIAEGFEIADKVEELQNKYILATRKTQLLEFNLWDVTEKIKLLESKIESSKRVGVEDDEEEEKEKDVQPVCPLPAIYLKHFFDQAREVICEKLGGSELCKKEFSIRCGDGSVSESSLWRMMQEAGDAASLMWNQFVEEIVGQKDLITLLGLSPKAILLTRCPESAEDKSENKAMQEQRKIGLAAADAFRNKHVFAELVTRQDSEQRPYYTELYQLIFNAAPETMDFKAAVYSLLQAVQEVAARGEGRDRDAHVLVQRSLLRQSAPLKDSIRRELSTRDPSADDWLWLQQHPQAVVSFVSLLEKDKRFIAVTSTGWGAAAPSPSNESDMALLTLSLSTSAAITKLGATAVSCPPFTSLLPEEISRQMLKLPELMPIEEVYMFSCSVGFKRQFLDNFGSRAADVRNWQDDGREGAFWINLIQQMLCAALVREGVNTKLKITDGIEDLQKDLGLFGFFVALGRSTRVYLASRGVGDSEESLASLLRYLDGGCVLFYPQLARVSSYQLFVEVVCEEMEWLSFYPGNPPANSHDEHKTVKPGVSKAEKEMALGVAVQTCSLWVRSFSLYNAWVRKSQGSRATLFIEKGQQRLEECFKAYNLVVNKETISRNGSAGKKSGVSNIDSQRQEGEASAKRVEDDLLRSWNVPNVTPLNTSKLPADQLGLQEMERQLKLFDKELQNVELAIHKLEMLLKESESNGSSGRETLSAIRVDLKRIWALKREVESLEASLKEEAGLLRRSLSVKDGKVSENAERGANENRGNRSTSSQSGNRENPILQGATNLGRGLVNFIFPFSNLKQERDDGDGSASTTDNNATADYAAADLALNGASAVLKEAETIEQLRGELATLEYRIQQAAVQAESERPSSSGDLSDTSSTSLTTRFTEDDIDDSEGNGAYGDVLGKSIEKLKETSSDAWRGTVLLGSDVGVAVLLLKRSVAGQVLTDREQKILKRTFTDLASVIPIGVLMLLPVTAVGHAAILAAIQKYVPGLIPSAYGRERLDVIRRLEQLKALEPESEGSDIEEGAFRQLNKSSSGSSKFDES